jgi:hypothetical protein
LQHPDSDWRSEAPAIVLATVEEGTQPEVAAKMMELHGESLGLDEGESAVTRAVVPAPAGGRLAAVLRQGRSLASLAMPPSAVRFEGKKMGAAAAP